MSFKLNPYANPSVGAPTPTGYNISGAERLAAGALTTGTNPIHSAADPTLAAAQFTDKGIEVADGSVVRVVLGDLGGGSFGLKLYQSDGSTAIIDGTSDMFRIQTSSTMSKATSSGDMGVSQTVALSSLGTPSTTPAHICYLSTGNATISDQHLGSIIDGISPTLLWAAGTSGGSPNQIMVAIRAMAEMHVHVASGTGFVTVILSAYNQSGGAVTFYGRYYILAQASL